MIHYDFVWSQSEDLNLVFTWERGDNEDDLSGVDLTGQSARMDIRALDRTLLATFNSDDIADTDPETPGAQPDTTHEITLAQDGTITIKASRDYLLPGGTIYQRLKLPRPEHQFSYDLFVRGTAGNQTPLVEGSIFVRESATLWS